jgi:DnaJ like chaperone protein
MAFGKWIGGYLGWSAFGPIGALIGFVVGAIFDAATDGQAPQLTSSGFSNEQQREGERNSFLLSMLVLAAYIIKADGRVMHSEMEVVRQMLRQNFGETGAQQGEKILQRLFEEEKSMSRQTFRLKIQQSCQQISAHMDYSGRLQLLNFLVIIAQADGRVDQSEVTALKEVAQWLQMSPSEVDSMLHLKGDTLEDAYKVLGLTPQATDDEVKKTYRRLALEHHPDRVAKLGEDVRRAAEKKFQEINAAKERIYKARGL